MCCIEKVNYPSVYKNDHTFDEKRLIPSDLRSEASTGHDSTTVRENVGSRGVVFLHFFALLFASTDRIYLLKCYKLLLIFFKCYS